MRTTPASATSSRCSRFTTARSKTSPRWTQRPSTRRRPSGTAATCLFPILLDAQKGTHGATIEAFGIHGFPTTILIDPQGKLVGEVSPHILEEKLTPIPLAKRIPRALDRDVAFGMDGGKLADIVKFLSEESRIPIKLDESALKTAGIATDAITHLTISGSLSLRSWLDLLLDPLGLEAVPGDRGAAIVPARRDKCA